MKNKNIKLFTEFAHPLGGGRFLANNYLENTAKNLYKKYISIIKNTQNIYKLNTQLIT